MPKMPKQIAFSLIMAICLTQLTAAAQDKVVLHNGDTLDVIIPGDPRRETNLSNKTIGSLNDYGYASIIVIYPGDSLRIHFPAQINSYIRSKESTYLGSGLFVSRTIQERLLGYPYQQERAVFLQRISTHQHITCWYFRENLGQPLPYSYFFAETSPEKSLTRILNFTAFKQFAMDHPPLDSILNQHPLAKKKKLKVAALYRVIQDVMESWKQQSPGALQ